MSGQSLRISIAHALADAGAIDHVHPSLVEAFERAHGDLAIADLNLSSLDRMELLVVLEMEYGLVITPQEFSQFRSLGEIATHAEVRLARSNEQPSEDPLDLSEAPPIDHDRLAPGAIRLFRRVLRTCNTVAELSRAFTSLENRWTPLDVADLADWHRSGQLLSPQTPTKFAHALDDWLKRIEGMMLSSGRARPAPFRLKRIAPAVVHFTAEGDRAAKTLIVCFSTIGRRNLFILMPVLLQHTDAEAYDLLVIVDSSGTAFRSGVPCMGKTVIDVVEWVAGLELLGEYGRLRTMGCSAGAYPAMLTGRRIGAELALGIAGRFPSERHMGQIIKMLFHSWISSRRNRDTRVLMAYGASKNRDRAYAHRLAKITGADQMAIQLPSELVKHDPLSPLLELDWLADFLACTLFARTAFESDAKTRRRAVLEFPVACE